jgi:hypothetical protein
VDYPTVIGPPARFGGLAFGGRGLPKGISVATGQGNRPARGRVEAPFRTGRKLARLLYNAGNFRPQGGRAE